MSYRVTSWSSEAGVGRVEGEIGALDVERRYAFVDDFVIGEEVDLLLEDEDGNVVARDVAPARWRENGPALAVPAHPDLDALTARATKTLAKHTRVVWTAADADRLTFEVHDVDWPPPVTPPLAAFQFEGVVYVKSPSFSESYVRVTAVPWPLFRRGRATILRSWSLGTADVPDDAIVFRFEPRRFVESAGYVIAASMEVVAPVPRKT
ncbi:MAG: hypothetical protein U0235_31005 [Polyangiaceae bacterium]